MTTEKTSAPLVLPMPAVAKGVPDSRLPMLTDLHERHAKKYVFGHQGLKSISGYLEPIAMVYLLRQPCCYVAVKSLACVFHHGRVTEDHVENIRGYLSRIGDEAARQGLCLLVKYAESGSGHRGAQSVKIIEPSLMTTEDSEVLKLMKARIASDIACRQTRQEFYNGVRVVETAEVEG